MHATQGCTSPTHPFVSLLSPSASVRRCGACRLFLLVWACHLALLLLLPRLLGAKWALRISASPLFRPQSHPHLSSTASPSVTSLSQQRARPAEWRVAHGALAGWARAAGRSVGAFLLWPPAALVLLARERGVWTALVS